MYLTISRQKVVAKRLLQRHLSQMALEPIAPQISQKTIIPAIASKQETIKFVNQCLHKSENSLYEKLWLGEVARNLDGGDISVNSKFEIAKKVITSAPVYKPLTPESKLIASDLLQQLEKTSLPLNQLNGWKVLLKRGDPDFAEGLDEPSSLEEFNALLAVFSYYGNHRKRLWSLYSQIKKAGFAPNKYTFMLLLHGFSRLGDAQAVYLTLTKMPHLLPVAQWTRNIVNSQLQALAKLDDENGMNKMLDVLVQRQINPDANTINAFLTYYTTRKIPKNAVEYKKMFDLVSASRSLFTDRNVVPSAETFRIYFDFFSKVGNKQFTKNVLYSDLIKQIDASEQVHGAVRDIESIAKPMQLDRFLAAPEPVNVTSFALLHAFDAFVAQGNVEAATSCLIKMKQMAPAEFDSLPVAVPLKEQFFKFVTLFLEKRSITSFETLWLSDLCDNRVWLGHLAFSMSKDTLPFCLKVDDQNFVTEWKVLDFTDESFEPLYKHILSIVIDMNSDTDVAVESIKNIRKAILNV